MRLKLSIIVVLALFLYLTVAAYGAALLLKEFTFDEDKALSKWSTMILNGKVNYELIKRGGEGYVEASSNKACSALYYRIGYKLKDYPILSWRWRALQLPDLSVAKNDEERDDYAARVYVILPFLSFSSSKFIEYVWANDLPVGTIMDSPIASNVKLIVVRSGRTTDSSWYSESRNVYEDYLKAFGKEPKLKAGAIAMMCDADSTKSTAESQFDDIVISGKDIVKPEVSQNDQKTQVSGK